MVGSGAGWTQVTSSTMSAKILYIESQFFLFVAVTVINKIIFKTIWLFLGEVK